MGHHYRRTLFGAAPPLTEDITPAVGRLYHSATADVLESQFADGWDDARATRARQDWRPGITTVQQDRQLRQPRAFVTRFATIHRGSPRAILPPGAFVMQPSMQS